MQIHLNESELKQAITEYINHQGIDLSEREIQINLTAGRGDRGHYADITLEPQAEKADIFDGDPGTDTVADLDENKPVIDFGD